MCVCVCVCVCVRTCDRIQVSTHPHMVSMLSPAGLSSLASVYIMSVYVCVCVSAQVQAAAVAEADAARFAQMQEREAQLTAMLTEAQASLAAMQKLHTATQNQLFALQAQVRGAN